MAQTKANEKPNLLCNGHFNSVTDKWFIFLFSNNKMDEDDIWIDQRSLAVVCLVSQGWSISINCWLAIICDINCRFCFIRPMAAKISKRGFPMTLIMIMVVFCQNLRAIDQKSIDKLAILSFVGRLWRKLSYGGFRGHIQQSLSIHRLSILSAN